MLSILHTWGSELSPRGRSSVNETTTTEGPILPSGLVEAHHHVLRIEPLARQTRHQFLEQFLPHLDTAPNRPKDFNEDEVVGSFVLEIRIAEIEVKILLCKLEHAMELVSRRHTRSNERLVNSIQHASLERGGLRFAD